MLETELDWFTNYLFNRHQTVIYACHKSKCHPVFSGVPQGSILGPLLFVAYINDLPGVLTFSNIIMFADDTILFYSHKNMNDIQEGLDKDMNAVASWLNQNQLVINLNKGKTESMIFGTSQKLRKEGNSELTISVGANQIRSMSSYKYIGVQLDPTLSFNQHLNCVLKKAAGKIKVLKKVRSSLTLHAAQAVYQFMIAPTMAYGHFVYLELSSSCLAKFRSLENQAKKVILNGLRNESVALKVGVYLNCSNNGRRCLNTWYFIGIFINPNILYIKRKLAKQGFQKMHFEVLYIQIAQGLMPKHLTQALIKNAPSQEKISHC